MTRSNTRQVISPAISILNTLMIVSKVMSNSSMRYLVICHHQVSSSALDELRYSRLMVA